MKIMLISDHKLMDGTYLTAGLLKNTKLKSRSEDLRELFCNSSMCTDKNTYFKNLSHIWYLDDLVDIVLIKRTKPHESRYTFMYSFSTTRTYASHFSFM